MNAESRGVLLHGGMQVSTKVDGLRAMLELASRAPGAGDVWGELDSSRVSILFCNGPQCPQSPWAIRALLEAGQPTDSLAYYRGGVHDWVTLARPTEATS